MRASCKVRKTILVASLLLSGGVQADILFNGQWEVYLGPYYGDKGWQNITQTGQPTGNDNWSDFVGLWSHTKCVPNSWVYNTSWANDRIRIESDPTSPKQGMVARFEVRSGDHRNGTYSGERSEMYMMTDSSCKKLPVTQASGHEFYAIAVKLSPDWVPPQHESAKKGYTKWGSFMQLHGPNVYGTSPSLDLMAEEDFHLSLDGGDIERVVTDPKTGQMKHIKNDTKPYAFSNGDLRRGHWVQFVMDVVWAPDTTGSVRIYRRDDNQTDFTTVLNLRSIATLQTNSYVPTDPEHCNNCSPDNTTHYWRIGYYRSTSPDQTNVLWLGPFVRGTTFDEVATAAFGSSGDQK